jgi:hypothetical protein
MADFESQAELEKRKREAEAKASEDNMVNDLKAAGQLVKDKIGDWAQFASPSSKAQEAIERMQERRGIRPKKRGK